MPAAPPDDAHYAAVVDAIERNRLILFVGAGLNLCNRPSTYNATEPWDPDSGYLPSGSELAHLVATKFKYPANDKCNLSRVAQFVVNTSGKNPLDESLHLVFDRDYRPTPIHGIIASLPKALRAKGIREPNLLLITTNYDDLLENAFGEAGEDYDLLSYIRDGENQGRFLHYRHSDAHSQIIRSANTYLKADIKERSVIIKIHGAVERGQQPKSYNFVITEDNYIDYLALGDVSARIPAIISERFERCQFLFLGYSLSDWNMRAFYRSIKKRQECNNSEFKSWAVQDKHDTLEESFWRARGVDLYNADLHQYFQDLQDLINHS